MKTLISLLSRVLSEPQLSDLKASSPHLWVKGVTADSRNIGEGYLFVALQGEQSDGHHYLHSAVERGAVAILGEKSAIDVDLPPGRKVPYFQISKGRENLALIAAEFYDHPSHRLLMVGVTGTSGKTTTTYLLESILKAAGHQVGVLGTVNFRYQDKIIPSTHTTPGAVELQSLLNEMKQNGCSAVVMEVSSHSLKQDRVAFISFDAMVFTNLSPEHLDFHPDMEDYFQSKSILFTQLAHYASSQGKKPVAVINGLDPYGIRMFSILARDYSEVIRLQKYGGAPFQMTVEGIRGQIGDTFFESSLTGEFNISNIEAAIEVGKALELSHSAIASGITNLSGIPGRLERVLNSKGIFVWVDYAHKPDALDKVLKSMASIRLGRRVITVFGCGGDRDRKKRPVMGRIAVEKSDFVLITSDNPRTEAPLLIIEEILEGVRGFSNYKVEVDRKKAIFEAIKMANVGDLVLIAGKGHEDYQIIGTRKVHFDDREVALEAFHSGNA